MFLSPKVQGAQFNPYADNTYGDTYCLEAIQKGGTTTYALVVQLEARDWFFLETAHDSQGNTLPVQKLNQNVGRYERINEVVGVVLTRSYLDVVRPDRFAVRINGRGGQCEITIPGKVVQEFLGKVDSTPDPSDP